MKYSSKYETVSNVHYHPPPNGHGQSECVLTVPEIFKLVRFDKSISRGVPSIIDDFQSEHF